MEVRLRSEQQRAWEQQYAEAQARWEAHKRQVQEAEQADVDAAVAQANTAAYSAGGAAEDTAPEGSLASDEALQALRRSSPAVADREAACTTCPLALRGGTSLSSRAGMLGGRTQEAVDQPATHRFRELPGRRHAARQPDGRPRSRPRR